MALTSGFFNSVKGDRKYDAVQLSQIFDGVLKDGVYETYKKAFMVKALKVASENELHSVIIQPGRAWFNHTWSYNDADELITLPWQPDTWIFPSTDAVVLVVDSRSGVRENYFQVVEGPKDGSNKKPTLINEADYHMYPLAYIRRQVNETIINQRDIENAVGTSACPFAVGVVKGITTDELLVQWWEQFHNKLENCLVWEEDAKREWHNMIDDIQNDWNDWFNHVDLNLSGEVAGHLQDEIDAISFMYVSGSTLHLPSTGVSVTDTKLTFLNYNEPGDLLGDITASDIVKVGTFAPGTTKSISNCKNGDLIVVLSSGGSQLTKLSKCSEVISKPIIGYADYKTHTPVYCLLTVLRATTNGTIKFTTSNEGIGVYNFAYKIPATIDGNMVGEVGESLIGASVSNSSAKVGEIFITAGVGNDVSYNSRCTSLVKQSFDLFKTIPADSSTPAFNGFGFLAIGKVNTEGAVTVTGKGNVDSGYSPRFGVLKIKL